MCWKNSISIKRGFDEKGGDVAGLKVVKTWADDRLKAMPGW
jgi:hypothetical protein